MEISKAVALIPKSLFSKKNIADIQHHFKNVNINDVVYFYDGWTVHKDRLWAVVTTKELLVSNGFKLSLLGISRVELSKDESYAHITYLDTKVSVYYKQFSSYLVQTIVQGTINAYAALWSHAWQLEQKKNYKDAFYYHLEAAVNGANANALNSMGIYYFNGWYVKKNREHSYEWYEKASNAGNTYAMANLGLNYKNDKQYDKAWIHLNRGLTLTYAQNKATILNTAGLMLLHGYGTPKDYDKALSHFKQSSDRGNMYATYNLASHSFYYDYDFAKGIEYTILGIQQKHKTLKKLLGDCYRYGKLLPKNEESALHWYNEARAEDVSSAYLAIGDIYHDNKCYDEAIEEYNTGIEKGNNYGYYSLYKVYSNPEYPGYNLDEALYYLEKGVQKGSQSSMIQLAKMYLEGNGVVQDYAMAKELLEQAKAKEDLDANGYLALLYLNGWGVSVDKKKADALFDEAITDHNTAATYEYAKVCLTHKDYDVNKGIELLFSVSQRTGHRNCNDAKKALIDYLSTHPYKLSDASKELLIKLFNELYEVDASILDKKAELERLTNTPIPVYAIKEDIDWKTLKTLSIKEQLSTLLNAYIQNPRQYEVCVALGKSYFDLFEYTKAFTYYKQAFYMPESKEHLDVYFHYYYLCVEVNHEYDKGKYLYHIIESGYSEGKPLFIQLVHKYIPYMISYEFAGNAILYASEHKTRYKQQYEELKQTITTYMRQLEQEYIDPRLISSLFGKMRLIANYNDREYQEMRKIYENDYRKVYRLAKQGYVPAINAYLNYYYRGKEIIELYNKLNISITKEGILKLLEYYLTYEQTDMSIQTLRDAYVLFGMEVDDVFKYFTTPTEIDEAFYNRLSNTYALSKDTHQIALMTKLIKKEFSPIEAIMHAKEHLSKAHEEAFITDLYVLLQLYEKEQYDIVYQNVEKLAKQNNPEAQILLGKMYQYGHGVNKDIELAKQWYTKANNKEARLCLAHIAYDCANSPSEFANVFALYEELQDHIDETACNNVLQMLPFISVDYNIAALWKFNAYVYGNQQAGKEVATLFLTGMIDRDLYLPTLEEMALRMDPLALRILAAAHRMTELGIVDEEKASAYELQLMKVLTRKTNIESSSDYQMFGYINSMNETDKQILLDYLFSINKLSIKKVFSHHLGDSTFVKKCWMAQNHCEIKAFVKVDNTYHSINMLNAGASRHLLIFNKGTEISLVAIGDNTEFYFLYLKEQFGPYLDWLKDTPTNIKDHLTKEVDECWELHDNGEYEKAYEKVLPLAKQGSPKAMNMLGLLFYHGKGVQQDIHKAHEWFEMGIKKKYSPCYLNMGNLYYNYASDETLGKKYAYQYYLMVVDTASANTCKRALEILLSGIVPRDSKEAERWSNRLIELGEIDYLKSLHKES